MQSVCSYSLTNSSFLFTLDKSINLVYEIFFKNSSIDAIMFRRHKSKGIYIVKSAKEGIVKVTATINDVSSQ